MAAPTRGQGRLSLVASVITTIATTNGTIPNMQHHGCDFCDSGNARMLPHPRGARHPEREPAEHGARPRTREPAGHDGGEADDRRTGGAGQQRDRGADRQRDEPGHHGDHPAGLALAVLRHEVERRPRVADRRPSAADRVVVAERVGVTADRGDRDGLPPADRVEQQERRRRAHRGFGRRLRVRKRAVDRRRVGHECLEVDEVLIQVLSVFVHRLAGRDREGRRHADGIGGQVRGIGDVRAALRVADGAEARDEIANLGGVDRQALVRKRRFRQVFANRGRSRGIRRLGGLGRRQDVIGHLGPSTPD